MKHAIVWYTVRSERWGYSVSYLDPQMWSFGGSFGDLGEASQEFKACLGAEHSQYLSPRRFETQVQRLLRQRAPDEQRWQASNAASRASSTS